MFDDDGRSGSGRGSGTGSGCGNGAGSGSGSNNLDLNEAFGYDLEDDMRWTCPPLLPLTDRYGFPMFDDECLPSNFGDYESGEHLERKYGFSGADGEQIESVFRQRYHDQLVERYGEPIPPAIQQRCKAELAQAIADTTEFQYLCAATATDWAREKGIITAPGYGASPCALTTYVFGISEIDPIAYDLPFARFEPETNEDQQDILVGYDLGGLQAYRRYFSYPDYDDPMENAEILGMPELSVMRHAIENIAGTTHETIVPASIPIEDAAAYDLLAKGNLVGIPLFEDRERMHEAFGQLAVRRFADLVAIVALSERDAIDARLLWDYVVANKTAAAGELPAQIDAALTEAHGQIVFQEQIIQLAVRVGGFSENEACSILADAYDRKIEHLTVCEQPWADGTTQTAEAHWTRGATARGMSDADAVKLFDDICRNAPYSSCKAHAIAVAMTIARLAWLKAHYPREFMAGLLETRHGGFEEFVESRFPPKRIVPICISRRSEDGGEPSTFFDMTPNHDSSVAREALLFQDAVDACLSMGIPVRLPNINTSSCFFSVTPEGIFTGLADIDGVSTVNARSIIVARDKTDSGFTSLDDYLARVRGGARMVDTVRALVKAGAFDSLDPNRRKLAGSIAYGSAVEGDPNVDWDAEKRDFFEREAIGFEACGSGTGVSINQHLWYRQMRDGLPWDEGIEVSFGQFDFAGALAGDREAQDIIAAALIKHGENPLKSNLETYWMKREPRSSDSSAGGARNGFVSAKVNECMKAIETWAER